MGRTLVTGASGTIGTPLTRRLLAEGVDVRVAGRSPDRLENRFPGADAVRLDALDAATIPPALEDVEVVYYLIHSMDAGEEGFAERDRRAAANVALAARDAGVERIVYLGGLGKPEDDLSDHLASRQATGRTLAEHGPAVLELRAGIVLGRGSASFRMLWDLVHRLPLMVTPRWVETKAQPIALDDVVAYLAAGRNVELPDPHTIVEIGGKEVLSYREMMERLAQLRGRRRVILPVPVLTPRLSSLWCGLVTSVPASVARPLIDGVRNEVVVTGDAAARLFPGIEPVGFDEAIRRAEPEAVGGVT